MRKSLITSITGIWNVLFIILFLGSLILQMEVSLSTDDISGNDAMATFIVTSYVKSCAKEITESLLIHEFTDHSCDATGLAFSPDGQILAAGDGCGELILFDMDKFTVHEKKSDMFNKWGTVKTAYDDKGYLLAAGSGPGTKVHVYRTVDHSLIQTMTRQEEYGSVEDMIFIDDGEEQVLITGDVFFNVMTWSVQTGAEKSTWTGVIDQFVTSLVIRPDGKQVIAGNKEGLMQVRDINGTIVANLTSTITGSMIRVLECSPDSKLLAAGYGFKSGKGTIQIWNLNDSSVMQTLFVNDSNSLDSLLFHPTEPLLFSLSSDKTIGVWNLTDGSEIGRIIAHDGDYGSDLTLHPDGYTLASSSSDQKVKLWNLIELLNITEPVDDQDRDGMIDSWEENHGLDATRLRDKYEDNDGDRLVNILEYMMGSDPENNDTDGDTLSDHFEYLYGLNVTEPDNATDHTADLETYLGIVSSTTAISTTTMTEPTTTTTAEHPVISPGFSLIPTLSMIAIILVINRSRKSQKMKV
jgi:WD40 repeat protein